MSRAALLCAWLVVAPAAAQPVYEPVDRIDASADGFAYSVVLSKSADGFGGAANAYVTIKGKPLMIYTHPDRGAVPRFDETQPRGFGSFLGKGSRTVLYRMVDEGQGRSTLALLALQDGRLRRVATFAEGRVAELDGKTVVVVHEPLFGKLLTVSCAKFATNVSTAQRTDVLAWNGKKFVSVAKDHRAFFERRIKEGEEQLAALEGQRADAAGDYAGRAITLYYDYAAIGRAREGWRRLDERLEAPVLVPGAAECSKAVRAQLRGLLKIPADW